MQDTNFTEGDSFSDEVQVNLDMLGSLMLDWVSGEVDSTDVVAIDQGGVTERTMKLLQKLSQLACFSYPICNSPIFSFCTGPRHYRLTLG